MKSIQFTHSTQKWYASHEVTVSTCDKELQQMKVKI